MPVHLHDAVKSVPLFKDKGMKRAINVKHGFVPLLPPVVVYRIFKWEYSIYILFKETKSSHNLPLKKMINLERTLENNLSNLLILCEKAQGYSNSHGYLMIISLGRGTLKLTCMGLQGLMGSSLSNTVFSDIGLVA